MASRVRFTDQPNVTYVSSPSSSGSLVSQLFSRPLPPIQQEQNFKMDLFTAASIGDKVLIAELLLKNADLVEARNYAGWTAMMYAAYLGHQEVCIILANEGAKVDDCDSQGKTPLMLASACGNTAVVHTLLKLGASVARADVNGRSALHYAASCSQKDVVAKLLEAMADPNAADEAGMTPVLEACQASHEPTLFCLIEKGGDPFVKNRKGEDGEALAQDSPRMLQIVRDSRRASSRPHQPRDLQELLEVMNLSKYLPNFEKEHIDLNLFFSLTEKDLEEMGVVYGPKKRMLSVIQRYKETGVITVDSPLHPPPPYPSQQNEDITDLMATVRFIRSVNDATRITAMDALQGLNAGYDTERIHQLLTSVVEGIDQISARLSRHLRN